MGVPFINEKGPSWGVPGTPWDPYGVISYPHNRYESFDTKHEGFRTIFTILGVLGSNQGVLGSSRRGPRFMGPLRGNNRTLQVATSRLIPNTGGFGPYLPFWGVLGSSQGVLGSNLAFGY